MHRSLESQSDDSDPEFLFAGSATPRLGLLSANSLDRLAHSEVKERTAHRKLDCEVNWTTALSKVRSCGIQLFLGEDIEELITELQEAIAEALSPRRPGRSFGRKKKNGRDRFTMTIKRI